MQLLTVIYLIFISCIYDYYDWRYNQSSNQLDDHVATRLSTYVSYTSSHLLYAENRKTKAFKNQTDKEQEHEIFQALITQAKSAALGSSGLSSSGAHRVPLSW